jgi:DNA-binding Lrp family transcriptional regulator
MATRDRILTYIQRHGPQSRQQLCDALNISEMACLKQLQAMRVKGAKLLYRAKWQKLGTGVVPYYAIGSQPDAPAPGTVGAMKRCHKCGHAHPETPEFFAPRARHKNGFDSYCRDCRTRENTDYNTRTSSPKPAQPRYESDLPRVPVERIDQGNGITRVRFGVGWKAQPAQRISSSMGYASALSNTRDAPG